MEVGGFLVLSTKVWNLACTFVGILRLRCASMVYNQMSFNKKEAFVCWSVGDGCLDKKVDQTQVCSGYSRAMLL